MLICIVLMWKINTMHMDRLEMQVLQVGKQQLEMEKDVAVVSLFEDNEFSGRFIQFVRFLSRIYFYYNH